MEDNASALLFSLLIGIILIGRGYYLISENKSAWAGRDALETGRAGGYNKLVGWLFVMMGICLISAGIFSATGIATIAICSFFLFLCLGMILGFLYYLPF